MNRNRNRNRALGFALVVLVATTTTTPTQAASSRTKSDDHGAAAFGPFDAGSPREVTRAGHKGVPRRSHPKVGMAGQAPGFGPPPPALRTDPDVPEITRSGVNVVAAGLSSHPLYLASLFYAAFLTRTDGPRCQHLPTCSRFASQAVARHGLLGITMGLDRLIQPPSSSSLRLLPEIEWAGVVRFYDPVDNYEFWRTERFSGFPPVVPELPWTPTPQGSTSSTASPTNSPSLQTAPTTTLNSPSTSPWSVLPSNVPPSNVPPSNVPPSRADADLAAPAAPRAPTAPTDTTGPADDPRTP
jgi:hypothetical protein